MGTQEQDPQGAGVWCPVPSGGHDVPGAVFLAPVGREVELSRRELFWEGQDPVKFWESTGLHFTFTLNLTGNLTWAQTREPPGAFTRQPASGWVRRVFNPPHPHPPGGQRVWTNESHSQFFHPSEGSGLQYPSLLFRASCFLLLSCWLPGSLKSHAFRAAAPEGRSAGPLPGPLPAPAVGAR